MFDLEWTGRSFGDDASHQRAIDAAQAYCAEKGIDPAQAYLDATERDEWETWNDIEARACTALCEGWAKPVDNVSLIWR